MKRRPPRSVDTRALGSVLKGFGILLEDPEKRAEFRQKAKHAARDAIHKGIDAIGLTDEVSELIHGAVTESTDRYDAREAEREKSDDDGRDGSPEGR